MKKTIYILFAVILLFPFSGCIHEYPDGEGTDPTLLTVEVGLTLNLQWDNYENRTTAALRSAGNFRRRFIVEVWREGLLVYQQTVIPQNFTEGQTAFQLPESLTLHALEYRVAVWVDYAGAESEEGLYYNAANLQYISINEPYTGNTDYRDCHYATASLDLRPYRDQWNVKVQLDVDMVRPLAKYNVIATDIQDFIEAAEKKFPGHTEFGIRFSYGFYFPLAFNVWEGKPANSQLGVAFDGTLSLPADGSKEILLGSDYIFVNGTGSYIPLAIELISLRDGSLIGRIPVLNVPYQRGYITTIRGRFLNALFGSGGIGIDPGFDDDDINIDLDTL